MMYVFAYLYVFLYNLYNVYDNQVLLRWLQVESTNAIYYMYFSKQIAFVLNRLCLRTIKVRLQSRVQINN